MNCLYRTCVYVLQEHLEFIEGGHWANLKALQNQLDVLHRLVIQINKGVDPVHRSVSVSEIVKTADMLARLDNDNNTR